MTDPTIRVEVAGRIHRYPAMDEEFDGYLRTGGQVPGLHPFLEQAWAVIRAGQTRAVDGWVRLDDSEFVYLIEVTGRRRYRILGAAGPR